MLVKFFNTGKGSARHAFNYLLDNERVKNGTAKLLRGNPDVITFLTEQRMREPSYRGGALYTSGVLSFSAEESISLRDSHLARIAGRFENAIFPNLDTSRFNIAWILHNDKGRTELHFVIQNFDLESKKTFTPFVVERDLSRVNKFKDKVNSDFKLSDPNLVKSHYHVKGLKRLSEDQIAFYRELNKAYSQYVEEQKITGQNEPESHVLHSSKGKQAFLQKFITERFNGLKINRSSDKYASIDFNGSKMRLFYEKFVVKEFSDDFKFKSKQNAEKGVFPVDYKPFFEDMSNAYFQASKNAQAEKERLKREEEEMKKERLRIAEIEKQKALEAEKERLRLAEIEKQKALEAEKERLRLAEIEKQKVLEAEKERLRILEQQLDERRPLLQRYLSTAITGAYIFNNERPIYYNRAINELNYIEEHYGKDAREKIAAEFADKFEQAYKAITGKSLTMKLS